MPFVTAIYEKDEKYLINSEVWISLSYDIGSKKNIKSNVKIETIQLKTGRKIYIELQRNNLYRRDQ